MSHARVASPRNIRFNGIEKTAKNIWMNGTPINCDNDVAMDVKENAMIPERMKYLEFGNCSNLSIFSTICLSACCE